MADDITADVVIVGSGIAGALLAARLAADGVKVAILEAGAEVDRGTAVQTYWDAAIKVPECAYPAVPQAMHPVSNDLRSWYEQAGPDLFASTYLKVVGGTTWHWLGTCLRFVPNDFRLKSLYGQGADWPIAYDDLEPFYGEAETEVGVSGDGADDLGAPRTTPYPMPAIPQTYLDKTYATVLAGTAYAVRPTPQGRNSQDRGDRPGCCGSASCIPVCPVQAKYDATVHLGQATAAGAVLHDRTTAVFVEVGADRRVDGYPLQALGRQRGAGVGQGVRAGRARGRDAAAAAELDVGGDAAGGRQFVGPGRAEPDGPSDAALLGAGRQRRSIRIAGRFRPRGSRTCATARSARTAAPSASRSATTAGPGRPVRRSPPRPSLPCRGCAVRRSTRRCAIRRRGTSASRRSWSSRRIRTTA